MSVQMGNTIDNNGPMHRPNTRVGQSATPKLSGSASQGAVDSSVRAGSQSARQDQVSFSDSVALLQRMQTRIETEPSVDSDRVKAARAAIQDGSYQIDHGKIASRLMALDKELP